MCAKYVEHKNQFNEFMENVVKPLIDDKWSDAKDRSHEEPCDMCGKAGSPVKMCADCSYFTMYCFSCWVNEHIHGDIRQERRPKVKSTLSSNDWNEIAGSMKEILEVALSSKRK